MHEIPLIDRIEEMTILKETVHRVQDGQGSVLLLLGEPGIGKTRLSNELKNYARSLGIQVLSGRCPALFQVGGIPPYSLWSEVIKDYLDTCRPETLLEAVGPYPQEVFKLVPDVWRKLEHLKTPKQLGIRGWIKGPGLASGFPETTSIGPENERFRLLEAVSKFIENISKSASCIIVLDDLQWADQSSLLLFHYLGQSVLKSHLALIGIYRDTEIDEKHPLRPVISELERDRLSKSVHLKRLPFNESANMIQALLGEEHVSAEFGRAIHEKTAGNPYFIEEVLRSLIETGGIHRQDKSWRFDENQTIRLPDTVRELIQRRLSRLDDDHLQFLIVASIMGKEFSFDIISQVTGIREDKLLAIMDRILQSGLIEEQVVRGEEIYVFSDILVRNVVYDGISRIRRRRLHGSVAQVMEKLYAEDIDDHLGELACHFLESGERAKAANYFVKAGERAMKVYSHHEATSHFSKALRVLEEEAGNTGEKANLQETLGDALVYEGQYGEALEHWAKALQLLESEKERRRRARLHTKRAHLLWANFGDKDKASQDHEGALLILEKEPESSDLAKLYQDISWMLWRFGDTPKSREFTEKAFNIGRRLGDKEVLARSYGMMGGFERDALHFKSWVETYETMLKIALEINDVELVLIGYESLAVAKWDFEFEPEKAEEYLGKGLEFAKKVGHLEGMTSMTAYQAYFCIDQGEYRRAIQLQEEALILHRKIGNPLGALGALDDIGSALLYLGELDRSQHYLTERFDASKRSPEFQGSAFTDLRLGMLHLERGDFEEAKRCLEKSRSMFKSSEFIGEYSVYPPLAQAYLATGEYERASEIIGQFYDRAISTGWRRNIPVALRLKGMLYRARGNIDEAIRLLTESLQLFESMGSRKWLPYELAITLYELGLAHSEKEVGEGRERARSCLNDALQIFEKIDAKRWIEKTIVKKTQLETQEQAKTSST